jgi:hypothetical protein
MVNRAIEDMVCSSFGEPTWQTIRDKAKLDVDLFVGMDAYPDHITYDLVAAASETLQMTPAAVLEAFGEYWVTYTAREGYGHMLGAAGYDLPTVLQHLDHMHARVATTFHHLQPPSFQCTDIADGSLQLHYYSNRPGLAHLVIGLVRGLGKIYNTAAQVTYLHGREEGHDHDVFLVRY